MGVGPALIALPSRSAAAIRWAQTEPQVRSLVRPFRSVRLIFAGLCSGAAGYRRFGKVRLRRMRCLLPVNAEGRTGGCPLTFPTPPGPANEVSAFPSGDSGL